MYFESRFYGGTLYEQAWFKEDFNIIVTYARILHQLPNTLTMPPLVNGAHWVVIVDNICKMFTAR